jgi:hypothetical protein
MSDRLGMVFVIVFGVLLLGGLITLVAWPSPPASEHAMKHIEELKSSGVPETKHYINYYLSDGEITEMEYRNILFYERRANK